MSVKSLFQTMAGSYGMTYAELLEHREFREAVDKYMQSDDYKKEHDEHALLVAKNNLKESNNE